MIYAEHKLLIFIFYFFGKLIDKCSFVRNCAALEVEKARRVMFLCWSMAAFRLVSNDLERIAWTQFFRLCH